MLFRLAAALCFLAVALGAFGAHSLRSTIESHGMIEVWNKAVLYHFLHAVALFVLALHGAANRGAWWLLFAGIFLFSGSLYMMALIPQAAGLARRDHAARRFVFPRRLGVADCFAIAVTFCRQGRPPLQPPATVLPQPPACGV